MREAEPACCVREAVAHQYGGIAPSGETPGPEAPQVPSLPGLSRVLVWGRAFGVPGYLCAPGPSCIVSASELERARRELVESCLTC